MSRPAARPTKRTSKPPVIQAARARLDVDERRAQLIAFGLAAFSDHSYDEVSIDELARTAGVSKGLLYHYFPTKRDLYVAALGDASRQLLDETRGDPELPPDERLRRSLSTYLDFVGRHGKAYAALVRGGVGSDPQVGAIVDGTRATIAARILVDLPPLPPQAKSRILRMALRGWIGFVEATAIDWMTRPVVRRDELLALLAGSLVDVVARAGVVGEAVRPARASKGRRAGR